MPLSHPKLGFPNPPPFPTHENPSLADASGWAPCADRSRHLLRLRFQGAELPSLPGDPLAASPRTGVLLDLDLDSSPRVTFKSEPGLN